jgi:hypothetical protein
MQTPVIPSKPTPSLEKAIVSIGSGVAFKAQSTMSLKEIYKRILDPLDHQATEIGHLRGLSGRERDHYKSGLEAFTLSAQFPARRRKKDEMISHTGRLQIDLDEKDHREANLGQIRSQLFEDPHIELVCTSPSGKGLKAVMLIPVCDDPGQHEMCFRAAERYLKQCYGLQMDRATKDVSRLCFLPSDPEALVKWGDG